MNSIWIWGESVSTNTPAPPPTLSVSAWPYLFGKEWVRWNTLRVRETYDALNQLKQSPPDAAFINLFHTDDSNHAVQIKNLFPKCVVVAMPDPTLDLVLAHTDWQNMYRQMQMADIIGGRTRYDCEVYGALLNKPTVLLPSPVGPDDWFAQFRGLDKEDYLITLDHRFAPSNTVLNVAAVTEIQRKTGCKVLYAAERDQTMIYARLAGLDCEFLGDVPFTEFCKITAKARLCVDMYASHSYGRQGVLCAEVGTFCVGSGWCTEVGQAMVDPFDVKRAVEVGVHWWQVDEAYRANRTAQALRVIDKMFGFEASKARIEKLLNKIEVEFKV
jgi:hypothetical protein